MIEFNTTKAKERLGWLADPPLMIDWTGEQLNHLTEMRRGVATVLAKTEEGRAICWRESAGESPGTENTGQFVRLAPPGCAVLGYFTEADGFLGCAVLGSVDHGGPRRWSESSLEDHYAALVKWGIPLAPTRRIDPSHTPQTLEEKLVDFAVKDAELDGVWMRSTGLGNWYQWRPQYAIDLLTLDKIGLATKEGYPVSSEHHGFAPGHVVMTTYRGVRNGKLTERGDIYASQQGQPDDVHVDERLVRYWHSTAGKAEFAKVSAV